MRRGVSHRTWRVGIAGAIGLALAACGSSQGGSPAPDDGPPPGGPDMHGPGGDMRPVGLEMGPEMGPGPGPDMGDEPPDQGTAACAVPLEVSPAQGAVVPLQRVRLQASGGTGNWRFEFVSNESEGIVGDLTGEYLAGRLAGVTDVIRVRDTGCQGEATAQIEVLEPMQVEPQQARLRPFQSFDFEVTAGSEEYVFSMLSDGSGGGRQPRGDL